MKSSTLIVAIIILVAQAILIMGVYAAVPIENSGAGVGEKKATVQPDPKLRNWEELKCCDHCNPISPQSDLFTCQDEFKSNLSCAMSNCRNCKTGKWNFTCNDQFNGTCGRPCSKN